MSCPLSGARFVNDNEHVLYHADLRAIESYLEVGRAVDLLMAMGKML